MPELIQYELQLPSTRTGEKLAKTIGRILKHTYSATRLRIEHSKDTIVVRAKVEKAHLHAIRGAVQMTLTAKRVAGELHRAIEEQSTASGYGDSGTQSFEAVQAESVPASHDTPAAS